MLLSIVTANSGELGVRELGQPAFSSPGEAGVAQRPNIDMISVSTMRRSLNPQPSGHRLMSEQIKAEHSALSELGGGVSATARRETKFNPGAL